MADTDDAIRERTISDISSRLNIRLGSPRHVDPLDDPDADMAFLLAEIVRLKEQVGRIGTGLSPEQIVRQIRLYLDMAGK